MNFRKLITEANRNASNIQEFEKDEISGLEEELDEPEEVSNQDLEELDNLSGSDLDEISELIQELPLAAKKILMNRLSGSFEMLPEEVTEEEINIINNFSRGVTGETIKKGSNPSGERLKELQKLSMGILEMFKEISSNLNDINKKFDKI
jgi:hypothetical protein